MSGGELLGSLWASSASAAVLILAALLLRVTFQDRTPRRVFCLLWDVALVRLLILAALPSPVSIWQWFPTSAPAPVPTPAAAPGAVPSVADLVVEGTAAMPDVAATTPILLPSRSAVFMVMWLTVTVALAVWFLRSHLRFHRTCADSLPCRDSFLLNWLAAHPLRRSIRIRRSDRIAAPLTYGVVRPVILLPSAMDWNQAALSFVLEHEYQHIRRFDTLRKALLAAALCLHWFNPLVWTLYVLSNRDMELACDEAVTDWGADRVEYARTLLGMEERRSQLGLSGSHFSQSALEERIRSIMKYKKTSITALVAVLIVMSVTVTVFASAAPVKSKAPQDGPEIGYVYNHYQAVEGETLVRSQDGEEQYSVDGGKTWLNEERYHAQYGSWGDDWQVEWWTAEDYAAWLEEEKQVLQSIIGERGYTSSEGWFVWDQARVDESIALYESILENIRNGVLYSKTITTGDGSVVEDVALGSGTLDASKISSHTREDTIISEILDKELSFSRSQEPAMISKLLDETALLGQLRAFGIFLSDSQMTYKGQSIRYLVDGVRVGDNGYATQHVYIDPEGTVDIHTLYSATGNPDGSYDLMGKLIGVAAEGEPGFDQGLINSALVSNDTIQISTEVGTDSDVDTMLEPYRAFGLKYEYTWNQAGEIQLRMSWNGKKVHSLYDTEKGIWFANNMNGFDLGSEAVDLETVYQGGKLCGLQESLPPHSAMLGQVTYAEGTSDEGGTTFEEIFARYASYGLSYSPREGSLGSLTWNGQAVSFFADLKPDGGAFSYQVPGSDGGLRVFTQYDEAGNLIGLREE